MVVTSNNLDISLNGTVLVDATSVSLEISRELLVVTKSPSNGFIQRIPGIRDSSLSFDGYLNSDALNAISVGVEVQWRFFSNQTVFSGDWICY